MAGSNCPRCSMASNDGRLCRLCFDERAKAVYWDKSFKACRMKGPDKAECLLEVGHDGKHEGNGFDQWGPLYRRWDAKRTSLPRVQRGERV